MSDFVTFNDKHKKFQISVKTEFLQKCPDPENYDVFELNSKFYAFKFLHNPTAPAVVRFLDSSDPTTKWEDNSFRVADKRVQYWLDGIYLNKEDLARAEKMHHDSNFNTKLIDSLG